MYVYISVTSTLELINILLPQKEIIIFLSNVHIKPENRHECPMYSYQKYLYSMIININLQKKIERNYD